MNWLLAHKDPTGPQAVGADWLLVHGNPGLVTSLSRAPRYLRGERASLPWPWWYDPAPNAVLVGPRWAVCEPMEDQSLSSTHCLSVFKGLSPLNPGILGDE